MRRTTKSFSPVLSHGKFKQIKVKTKIINGSPAPVYKWLEAIECLRTDSSGIICDGYATQDSRIRVFHKSNGGVSSARNLGLDNALGEWVCFIDSDDEIRNLESLCISQSKSDVILFTLRMIDGNGMSYSDPLMAFSGASDIKENYLKAYLHFHIFNSVCA